MGLSIDYMVNSFEIGVVLVFLREFVMELVVNGAQTGESGRLLHNIYGKIFQRRKL